MKKLYYVFFFLVVLAFSCSKDSLLNDNQGVQPLGNTALKASGPVFEVSPGPNATANLILAFDQAIAAGKGAVVKLLPGTYEIGWIEVKEFYGTLIGAGKGETIITNLPDLVPDEIIGLNKLPALITFIGGDVAVSNLSVNLSEGLSWLGINEMNMLLFSDYSADFMPSKQYIKVNINSVEITGLLIHDVELWPEGPVVDIPYSNFNGVMLAPDKVDNINPIPRSNIDVNVSNSSFSLFSRGIYTHGLYRGNLTFGTKGGNTFSGNNNGLVVNENIGVNVKILNNEFNTPLYYWNCIDLNCGEEVFGWKQFEDFPARPGTYDIQYNVFNTKNQGIGMMDTWRWVHPENPSWMQTSFMNNTFNLTENGWVLDLYCGKNVNFSNNVVYGDGNYHGFYVENFWWEPTMEYNSSDGILILNNHFVNQTVDFWLWNSNNSMLMGDLSNFVVNIYGENNKIIGKTNWGHSNEKFIEQAQKRASNLLKMFQK